MKRGPKCTACGHIKAKELDKDLTVGELSFAEMSEKYGLASHVLKLHKTNHLRPKLVAAAAAGAPEPPALPELDAGMGAKERAAAHCEWLRKRIAWAQAARIPEKEVAQLAGQYTNATRLLARLSGALDITESQIVRSAPWARLMVIVRDTLKAHPKALGELVAALERYESGEVK